jgi:Ca2+-binding RTX toxin-like protein
MAIFSWDGVTNLDLKIQGQTFDFRSDVLQISDPDLQAQQFDIVENGTDVAIVKARDAEGAPLPADEIRYAYLPNMVIRQIGGAGGTPTSSNIVLSNGGQLWVGDRTTDTLLDDAGNDVSGLSGAAQSVQVVGLGGPDTVATGDGNDRVYGNTGTDFVIGGGGNDSIYGGQGDDTVNGNMGDDQVAGDLGNDMLYGGAGNDVLYGGAGNDVIDPDIGNDTIFAGNGNDTVSVGNSDTGDKIIYMDKLQDVVNITSTTGNHIVYLGQNNDQANLDANAGDIQVSGDLGNDTILAQNFGSDTLQGGGDDDVVGIQDGSQGEKLLYGGDGNDSIFVGDSSSGTPNTTVTVDGDEGNDTVQYVRGLFFGDANDGGDGVDAISFGQASDLTLRDLSLQNFESVTFSGEADEVIFADGNVAAGATMTVSGGASDDVLDASAETDGSYVLGGNMGDDTLSGGGGADQFDVNSNGGADVVTNFSSDQGDQIVLQANLNGTTIDSFAELQPNIADDGMGNALIDLGGGNTLLLLGVQPTSLTADDFVFTV